MPYPGVEDPRKWSVILRVVSIINTEYGCCGSLREAVAMTTAGLAVADERKQRWTG